MFRPEQAWRPLKCKAYMWWLIFGLAATCLCTGQQLKERMTNQDVIDMVALGLSDDVIIDKIHTVESTQFDTSVKELKTLKAARVSDLVIRAMITPHRVVDGGAILLQ